MKCLAIFNAITNILIVVVLVYYVFLRKHFHISLDREIFTDKIESISLWKNTGWFEDGRHCSAKGLFTIPIRKIS